MTGVPRTRPRKPWHGAVLSLLLPGLGHLYAGQPQKAMGRWALSMGVGLTCLGLIFWLPFGALTLLISALAMVTVYGWIAVDAARTARAAPPNFVLRPYNRWYLYAALVFAASFLADIPKAFLQTYRIPSGAMRPTFEIGDFLFARALTHRQEDLSRGMIVVFESVEEPGIMTIKRIVGLPGDTLAMQNGVLLLNGSPVAEPYLPASTEEEDHEDPSMRLWQVPYYVGDYPGAYRPTVGNWGPLRVPSDSVFVLGDNRHNSYDSRYYGWVGRDRLRARPLVIYFSYDKNGPLPLPFFTAIRSDRIGIRFH